MNKKEFYEGYMGGYLQNGDLSTKIVNEGIVKILEECNYIVEIFNDYVDRLSEY